jgi:hypothetical protein
MLGCGRARLFTARGGAGIKRADPCKRRRAFIAVLLPILGPAKSTYSWSAVASGRVAGRYTSKKVGIDVAVIEARFELGNFCPRHETSPETLDSPHASINLSSNSPAIEDLELESGYGYRIRVTSMVLGTAHPDGMNSLICYDRRGDGAQVRPPFGGGPRDRPVASGV